MNEPDTNQSPPFEGRNLYLTDRALRDGVKREGAGWAEPRLSDWGEQLGSSHCFALAARANRYIPELATHDRFGNRIDDVAFDPAWHELMSLAMREGEHCAPWTDARPGAQVARAAAYLMHAEVECGTQCPLTMTYAAVPVLQRHAEASPWLGRDWLPRILSTRYDPRSLPVTQKTSALIGMGMTERQGGSDVRTNTTRALVVYGADGTYRVTGQKWFFSAPMCDAHLVLAQTDAGLTCFFLPRLLPDGTRNHVRIQRLKDKLGNRSNASSEVEFDDALAYRLGDEGRGIGVIIEMVHHTRQDCAIGSAGLMRSGALQALHHARHRRAFGKILAEHALMQNVLADLLVETEAATAVVLRLARMFEHDASPDERALARVATPALKYWLCKRAVPVVAEALEVLGGNGYVEENILPRLYREAPLNSIWEGSGNVICLDVLRAARREPAALDALRAELALAHGADSRLDRHVAALDATLVAITQQADDLSADGIARRVAGSIATALAGALLVRFAPAAVADVYCASRFGDDPSRCYGGALGTLPAGTANAAVIAHAS